MITRSHRVLTAAALGLGSALILSSCTPADDGPPDPTTDPSAEATAIRVSTLGFCDDPIVWGIDQGIFAEAGLDIELTTVQSGAAGISALQADEIDIAYANPLTSLQAIGSGVGLYIVSGSTLSNEDSFKLIVSADSNIDDAADLDGGTVATNALGSQGQILSERWIADNGSGAAVEFVALPFADQVPSVVNGTVDAAAVGYTQAQGALEDGSVVSLGNPFYDGIGEIPTSFYVADSSWADDNEAAAAAFASAMTEVAESASDPANDDERFMLTAAACGSTPEDLAETAEPDYTGQLEFNAVTALVDILVDAEAVEEVDIESVLPEWARAE